MNIKNVTISPIGIIHTPFTVNDKLPRQGRFSEATEGFVELDSKYKVGLMDLESFSHVILIFYFHKSKDYNLIQTPSRDNKPRGVFATRSPHRPSGIGLTIVRIKAIKDNIIEFYGADMINGTPLLDIKPFIPDIDCYSDASRGWLEN